MHKLCRVRQADLDPHGGLVSEARAPELLERTPASRLPPAPLPPQPLAGFASADVLSFLSDHRCSEKRNLWGSPGELLPQGIQQSSRGEVLCFPASGASACCWCLWRFSSKTEARGALSSGGFCS